MDLVPLHAGAIGNGQTHRRGIAFANAPGCNAAAAAQYVLACVLRWCAERGRDLAGLRVGIVGCGQVGSRVLRLLQACGAECRVNDPPRARREGEAGFVELDALDDCDLITLHVPLSRDGPDPTWHLFDRARLARLKPGMLLINAARGAVIDNPALLERLGESALEAVLDTWEGEPAIDSGLLAACYLGTPHIAGYSLDGRLRGTEMVYRALCRFLGREPRWSASRALPPPAGPIPLPGATAPQEGLRQAVLGCYDPAADCARLRSAAESATGDLGARFDQLRREYPPRREFTACRLLPAVDSPAELCRWLHDFGFLLPDS